MTRAFLLALVVTIFLLWISLSIEHGKSVGRDIKRTIKQFFNGKENKHEK